MPAALVVVIAAVWAALIGTALIATYARWSRRLSLAAVTACYLVLAAGTLLWLGLGANGWLGAGGMLAPYAAAVALTIATRT